MLAGYPEEIQVRVLLESIWPGLLICAGNLLSEGNAGSNPVPGPHGLVV